MREGDDVAQVVGGSCKTEFEALRNLLESSLGSGSDVGASVCVTVEGEVVVDLWGGWADEVQSRPWQADTIVNVYSTTKTMTALVMLILADRGLLDLEAPVARYWPEFAVNGKADITVTHVLSHSSGLSGWQEKITVSDLYDWEKATSLLAAQAPFWKPGTALGYHAMTHGFLLGEVVRRVTGRTLGQFFREEIAGPLGADFFIGFGPDLDGRVADLIPPPSRERDLSKADPIQLNVMTNPPLNVGYTRTREWRAAEIPAANGHGNARSIATVQAVLANGGTAQGIQFVSEATCRKAAVERIAGLDPIVGKHLRFGLGFALSGEVLSMPNQGSMFWGGGGGSLAVVDMDSRMSLAFAMNKMSPMAIGDPRSVNLAQATWKALAS